MADTEVDTGRDPRHLIEDAIEEQGDEYIAHSEYYDGVDEFPIKTCDGTAEHTALVLKPPTKFHTMAVLPGRCTRGFIDITSFLICIVLVILQAGLFDYYYITNLSDKAWYGWIGADVVVIIVLVVTYYAAFRHNQVQMEEVCSIDSKVRFAWVGWLVYSMLLVGKVATCFNLFHHELPPSPLDHNDKLFDDTMFKWGLAISIAIFYFHLESHHYTPLMSTRQMYINYLATAVCLDLIDAINFLDLLWQSIDIRSEGWNLPNWLAITILAVACINFIMPTFALFRLRFGRFPKRLLSDKIWSFLYVLMVNGPLLGLRIYLYYLLEIDQSGRRYEPREFAMKNAVMILLALRDLWTRLQYWRVKRRATQSRGAITSQLVEEEQ